MSEPWYVAHGGHQIGPIPAAEVETMIRNGGADGETHVFTSGIGEWIKVRDVPQFASRVGQGPAPGAIPAPPGRQAHEIDFTIEGTEMQFVEVQLESRRERGGGGRRDDVHGPGHRDGDRFRRR